MNRSSRRLATCGVADWQPAAAAHGKSAMQQTARLRHRCHHPVEPGVGLGMMVALANASRVQLFEELHREEFAPRGLELPGVGPQGKLKKNASFFDGRLDRRSSFRQHRRGLILKSTN